MITLGSALAEFFLACETDGLKGTTIAWYRWILGEMGEEFLPSTPLEEVTTHQIREYLLKIRRSGKAENTISAHNRAMHKFWKWAGREYRISDPMTNIKYPSPQPPKPRTADMGDVIAMFQTVDNPRDKAILAFLLDTGCRAAGLCSLKMEDLDLSGMRALVTEKGSKTRAVLFSELTQSLLRDWLSVRAPVETVFHSLESAEPLTRNALYLMLRRLAKRAGVKGRFNPHSFRHLFSKTYLMKGGDLASLSKLLGHRDVSTTVAHYVAFTDSDLRRKHNQYSPIDDLKSDEEKE